MHRPIYRFTPLVQFLAIALLVAACDDSSSEKSANAEPLDIFPIGLADQQCLSGRGMWEGYWVRKMLVFDDDGYRLTGEVAYSDSSCTNELGEDWNGVWSTYPYMIGETVTTSDDALATILQYPDPEGAGPYGTVFLAPMSEWLCFAVDSLSVRENGMSITPTDVEGDFSAQEIDYGNCWEVRFWPDAT
jgi:hypothetical protein